MRKEARKGGGRVRNEGAVRVSTAHVPRPLTTPAHAFYRHARSFVTSGDSEGKVWFWDWKTCRVLKYGRALHSARAPLHQIRVLTARVPCSARRRA